MLSSTSFLFAIIAISIIILQDKTFSKAIAYVGILSNIFTLGLYVPVIGILILLFSLIFFEAWIILLALRLFQLGKAVKSKVKSYLSYVVSPLVYEDPTSNASLIFPLERTISARLIY